MKLLFQLTSDDYGLTLQRSNSVLIRLMLLILSITILSFCIDQIAKTEITYVVFLSIALSCILVLLLCKLHYFKLAKITGVLVFNYILFNISSIEPVEHGFHIHFFSIAFASLILFGHEDRFWGILFILISFALHLYSSFESSLLYKTHNLDAVQGKLTLLSNCFFFGITNVYLFVLILRLNYKAEEKLRITNKNISLHNEELKKINVELDRFVYSASHDLRAPISSVLGLLSLQKMDPAETTDYLAKIENRIHAMDKFVCDILDYHKNTRAVIQTHSINLHELVMHVVELLKYSNPSKQIRFNIDVPQGITLQSDPFRVRVILNNLVSNSIKYADYNKPDPYVTIKAYIDNSNCYIKIMDNGIGINDEMQPKIFDMFFRATEAAHGSGLGLYILKESLDKIGGTISLTSQVGFGSKFVVTIPS